MRSAGLDARAREDLGLDLLDVDGDAVDDREVVVDDAVGDRVEDRARADAQEIGVGLEVQAHVVQRAALAVADGDHEARAEEDHHLADLDELLAVDVARGLEHDEERVAAVDLELGPLVGVDGVLDGQRVQLEVPADRLDHPGLGSCRPIHTKPSWQASALRSADSSSTRPPSRSPASYRPQSTTAERISSSLSGLGAGACTVAAPLPSPPRRTGIRRGSGNHEEPSDGTRQAYPGLGWIRARSATDRAAPGLAFARRRRRRRPRSRWPRPPRWSIRWPRSRRSSRWASSTCVAVLLVSRLGRLAGRRHGAGQRAGVQLLPHPADRPLHDLRGRELGRARRLLHRRAGGQHAGRGARVRAARGPGAPGRRPIWPPRWRACCCAARVSTKRCRRSPSASPTPSSSRRRRSSSRRRRRRATRGAAPATSARCSCRPTCRRMSSSACASASSRRSRRSSGPPSSATRSLREVVETSALRRSDDLKTALLRAVSHDLRSPLTAILTAVGALGSSSLSTSDERASWSTTSAARPSAWHAWSTTCSTCRAWRRGTAEPRVEWCSIEEVIVAAVDDVAPAGRDASRWRSTPTCRSSAPTPRSSSGPSPTCWRTPRATPAATRSRCARGRSARASSCASSTAGPGVPAAETARIFEPFYRAPGDADGHRGSGLGLAIVRGFVEANGGRVWVESLPGPGRRRFVVELPLWRPRA